MKNKLLKKLIIIIGILFLSSNLFELSNTEYDCPLKGYFDECSMGINFVKGEKAGKTVALLKCWFYNYSNKPVTYIRYKFEVVDKNNKNVPLYINVNGKTECFDSLIRRGQDVLIPRTDRFEMIDPDFYSEDYETLLADPPNFKIKVIRIEYENGTWWQDWTDENPGIFE
jgi:hypothetical protein